MSLPTRCASSLNLFDTTRSEEHTSELQSRPHPVCRLLLEKKNIKNKNLYSTFYSRSTKQWRKAPNAHVANPRHAASDNRSSWKCNKTTIRTSKAPHTCTEQ